MRKHGFILLVLFACFFLTGCLTAAKSSFKFDYTTGLFESSYHDIRSQKGLNEDDYSAKKDWEALKSILNDGLVAYEPDVIENVSREVFPDGDALSGKLVDRVKCPKCFPSKAAIFSMLHGEDWHWESIQGDIFLVLPSGKSIISTNGQIIHTTNNCFIVWPESEQVFEYALEESAGGESLLPFYKSEQQKTQNAETK